MRQTVKDNLEKCRSAAVTAVEVYNRPGPNFRTAHYLVMITISWTALFHAIFYHSGRRPWYRKKTSSSGSGIRYQRVDGEPKHWELAECLKQFYGNHTSPERRNLEFLLGLRNKIEHRNLPELDASLYGECQATLINLEALLVQEFGQEYALAEQLVVALQFSQVMPEEKRLAAKSLASTASKGVRDYVEKFRGSLPSTVLNSMKYSFNVFLVPKVANRESSADASVTFIRVDEASAAELERMERLNVLIREKRIPIANLDLFKPSQVLEQVQQKLPFRLTMNAHTAAWRHYKVRPSSRSAHPENTNSVYSVFDEAHGDYLYTRAWIEKLALDLSTQEGYKTVIGRDPIPE